MNFDCVATNLDTAPLMAQIEANPDWWKQITMRQDFLGSAHYATNSIYLRGPLGFTIEEYFQDLSAIDYPLLPEVLPALMRIMQPLLLNIEFSELGRILIVRLPAGYALDEHIDQGDYARHYSRFHVPLATNEQCELRVAGEAQHMETGEAWWFDHHKPHYAHNKGETDRVHLIVDAVSPRFVKTGRPDGPVYPRPKLADAGRKARAARLAGD